MAKRTRAVGEGFTKPFRKGASRAKELLAKLFRAARPYEARGRLGVLHDEFEELERSAGRSGLVQGFPHLRARFEALLAILLDVEDDRLAARAASGLQAELEAAIERAKRLFAPVAPSEACVSSQVGEALRRWLTGPADPSLADQAKLIMKGFALGKAPSGRAWVFVGEPIQWDSTSELSIHEHTELAILARAAVQLGDEALLAEIASRLVDWAVRVPAAGPAWQTIRVVERLLNWCAVFTLVAGASEFPAAALALLVRLAQEGAELLIDRTRIDHAELDTVTLARAGAALVVWGELLKGRPGSTNWSAEGLRALEEAAARGLNPDGSPRDMAAHELFFDALVTGGLALGGKLKELACSALEFERTAILPDGTSPDSPGEDASDGARRLMHLALAAELLGVGGPSQAVEYFREFPDSGVYVMSCGGQDRLLARMKARRGIVVASGGSRAIAVRLVARDETEPIGDRSSRAGPPCDYVRWIAARAGGALHRRELIQVERRYWVLADSVTQPEWALELDAECGEPSISADGRRLVVGSVLVGLAGPTDSGFSASGPQSRTARLALIGSETRAILVIYPLRGEDEHTIRIEPVLSPSGRAVGARIFRPGASEIVAFCGGEELQIEGRSFRSQVLVLSRPVGSDQAVWRTLLELVEPPD